MGAAAILLLGLLLLWLTATGRASSVLATILGGPSKDKGNTGKSGVDR